MLVAHIFANLQKKKKQDNVFLFFYLLPTAFKSLKSSYLNCRWIQSLLIHMVFFCFLALWMSMSVFLKITAVNYEGPYLSIDFYMCKSIAGYSPIINIGKLNCFFSQAFSFRHGSMPPLLTVCFYVDFTLFLTLKFSHTALHISNSYEFSTYCVFVNKEQNISYKNIS